MGKTLVASSLLAASSALAGAGTGPGPVDATLAFEYRFETSEELDDWVIEGPGTAEIENGRLILTPTFQPKLMELVAAGKLSGENDQKEYGPALEQLYRKRDGKTTPGQYTKGIFRGGPFNIWCRRQLPENYIIEWQFEALAPHALHMIMFGAKGLNGEDVLAPSLPERTGLASEIMHGGIHTYRVSFFHPERRTANMRKAPGRVMTASGPDPSVEKPGAPHRMRVIAWEGTFTYWVDGEKVFTFTDPDPVPGGQMGFRLMAMAKGAYSRLRVYELHQSPEKGARSDLPKGEVRLTAKALHPFWRTHPTPVGHEVDVNPPVLFWPSPRIEFTQPLLSYDVELARDAEFAGVVEGAGGQHHSFFVPSRSLEEGEWHWRYREAGEAWNGPHAFTVGSGSRRDTRPPASVFVEAVRGPRPRMVIPKERLTGAREGFAANGVTESIVKAARQYVDVELPEHEWGGKFTKNGERVFKPRKFPDDHIKSQITSPIWRDAISALCRAYLLTGEEACAREALRWSLRVATFDVLPESNLDFCGNPYPDSFCFAFYLDCMACAYDCLQDFMTEQQREMVRVNLAERLRIGYEYYCNRLENRCIDNHAWQISVGAFVRAVITAKGDVPEADRYLAYIYNVWRARDPEQSRTDGGWFGGGYVGVNIGAWTEVPTYFSRYSGHNFYDHPFYHSQPYWFLYRQPPGSHEDGFSGDGYGGNSRGIGEKIALWMGLLDAALDHPVAGWLADSAEIRREEKWRTFAWARQAAGLPLRSPRRAPAPVDLPQARAFRDIGIVNMHRDLLNPQDDLHVALRSSPYGTFGHNLASHNAFNVVYRGDYLFVPYGHRHGGAKNSAACYRHTRGHNSVLVNGKGQPFSPEAYGWIARFLHGKRVSYACGDASNAYDAAPFERETKLFGAADLAIDDHISRGKVTHFRRHLLFLRPSLIVVYDELEANEPVRWDWVLHCRHVMRAEDARLTVDGVDATVDVRGSTPMLATVKTKSIFQAVNVDGRGGQERNTPYPVEGSHAYVSSSAKTDRLRILALVQVGAQHQIEGENGQLTCGEWELAAEMDPGRLANLRVSTTAKTARFVLKTPETGASVLTETVAGTSRTFRAVDEIPYAARGVELLSAHSQERKKP